MKDANFPPLMRDGVLERFPHMLEQLNPDEREGTAFDLFNEHVRLVELLGRNCINMEMRTLLWEGVAKATHEVVESWQAKWSAPGEGSGRDGVGTSGAG